MQNNNTVFDLETFTRSDGTPFVQCVLKLIANSLAANAAAIAIRIHAEKREVHVIDDGIGIPQDTLRCIGEYDVRPVVGRIYELNKSSGRTLTNIRRSSDSLTVASRCRDSTETFMKVLERKSASYLTQIEYRPASGTTVSVYGFHEAVLNDNWNMSTLCSLVMAIAVTNVKVSFSIRDEERKKVVLRIAKPHSSVDVLRVLFGRNLSLNRAWSIRCDSERNFHGYIGLSARNAKQWIFLNHRLICCPFVSKLIKIVFRERIAGSSFESWNSVARNVRNTFILFFITLSRNEFTCFIENGRSRVMFHDIRRILNNVKTCFFERLADGIAPRATRLHFKEKFEDNGQNTNPASAEGRKVVVIGVKRKIITSTVATSYCDLLSSDNNDIALRATRLHLKPEIFEDNVDGQNPASSEGRQIVMIGVKRKIIASTIATNYSGLLSNDNNDTTEAKVAKEIHNDVRKTSSTDVAVPNNSIESDNKQCNSENNSAISPLSEWSNWTYHTNNKSRNSTKRSNDEFSKTDIQSQFFKCADQFDILPRKLHGFLQYHRVKLTNMKCFNSPKTMISLDEKNWQREQTAVHPCNLKRKLCEFRLSRASLKSIKIINQVNNEFIAAWMTDGEVKMLLMIDQHAAHERIRFDNLLQRYKIQNEDEFLSVSLREPLVVELPANTRDLLLRDKMLLKKYGINLGSSLRDNALLIRTVPQCLVANNDLGDGRRILPKIYGLLNDILNTTNHASTMPSSIHNAIASEACHGAIKFGDKLTLEQCECLVELLGYTQSFNRCAHGRPTVIPVMELSELEKRSVRLPGKKLNFASLRESH